MASRVADTYDLVVVGGGIFGLSVAWEAGRRGRHTLVLERRTIPNPIAASYGPSRKIRSTYLDPHYARLAQEAMAGWRSIEATLGVELYVPVGNLSFTAQAEHPRLEQLEEVARLVGSSVRVLDERALRAELPQLHTARRGLFEAEAGFLRASVCVRALQTLASRHGVSFATGQEVEAIEPAGSGLVVRTVDCGYQAERVVLAGGGWSGRVLPELNRALWQCPQGILYVEDPPEALRRPAFVPFSCVDNGFYGFPAEPGVGFKLAEHVLGEGTTDPDFDRSQVPAGFLERAALFLRDYFGLELARHRISLDSCMYNLSPSNEFLLDDYPELPGLFVATAGSGHGFKFGSILGSLVLDRLDGIASDRWSPQFSFEAFLSAAPTARPL